MLFLALRNVERKWIGPVHHWQRIYGQLLLFFGSENLNP